jgi:hypothetical protein
MMGKQRFSVRVTVLWPASIISHHRCLKIPAQFCEFLSVYTSTLKVDPACTFETLGLVYRTTLLLKPGDHNVNSCFCENLTTCTVRFSSYTEFPVLRCVLGNTTFSVCLGRMFHDVYCALLPSKVSKCINSFRFFIVTALKTSNLT